MTPSRTITATAVLSVAALASCGAPAQSHPTAYRATSTLALSRPAESMTATLVGAPEVQRRQTTARLADAVTGRIAADAAEAARVAAEARAAAEAQAAADAAARAEEVAAQEERDRAASAAPAPARATPPARAVAPTTTVVAAPRVTPRAFTGGGGGNTSGVSTDCESGSNYATNTGNGYYGAYQWLPSTFNAAVSLTPYADWAGTRPDLAPAYVQDAAAAAWVAAGHRGAWPNC